MGASEYFMGVEIRGSGMIVGSGNARPKPLHGDAGSSSGGEIQQFISLQQKCNDELLDAINRLEELLSPVVSFNVATGVSDDDEDGRRAASAFGGQLLGSVRSTENLIGRVNNLTGRLAL